jgi:hypothetical protein
MDWNQIRQRWQETGQAPAQVPDSDLLAAVQQRDSKLRRQVQFRDRLETVVALLIAPVFAYATWRAGLRSDWLPMFFSLWLTAWVIYVPWHLWRVRRRMPQPRPELALVEYLTRQRDAMLAQARMLERVWIWYLAPCAIGVIGLNVAAKGLTQGVVIYIAIVLAFCLFLGRLNQRAAKTRFRDVVEQIDQQLARLSEENNL